MNDSFGIVSQSNILKPTDFADLSVMRDELEQSFVSAQQFRTRTEMEVSVLNDLKFPTPAAKYWQAVREQNVQYSELVMLSYEYRKNLVEIKQLERKLEKETDDLERELLVIEIDKKQFIARNQERTAKARIAELREWSEIKQREAAMMTEGELAHVDNHQLKSYTLRWLQQTEAMGNNGSPAERQNLKGQLMSGLKACQEKGILPEILALYNPEGQKNIKAMLGVK